MNSHNLRSIAGGALVMLLTAATTSYADDVYWNSPSGGTFQHDINWVGGGMPGPEDQARFDLFTNGYTVDFNADAATDALSIDDDIVTFDLGGFTYTLADYIITGSPNGTSNLTIQNGSISTPSSAYIGGPSGLASMLTLTGPTASMNVGSEIHVAGSTGVLRIENGASLTDGHAVQVGVDAGTVSELIVTGAGSGLTVTGLGSLIVGNWGDGTLTIENGATMSSETTFIGMNGASSGAVTIAGMGSTWTNADWMMVGWNTDA